MARWQEILATTAGIIATIEISKHAFTPDIDMTGGTLSNILLCRLFRNSSDAADTFTGDVGLLYIDCHVSYDTLGSGLEYTK